MIHGTYGCRLTNREESYGRRHNGRQHLSVLLQATLRFLRWEKNDACAKAARAGELLTKRLQKLILSYNLPYVAYHGDLFAILRTTGTMFIELNLSADL